MTFDREILDALTACIPSSTKVAVVHSSLAHLFAPEGADKWAWLRVIRHMVGSGLTMAFPAFTFSFCKGDPYHFRKSLSETGLLADWVMELRGAVRTEHPIYSFALLGPLSAELAAFKNTTTFGEDSIFAGFEDHDARVVMLGCDWAYCTQFHRYEELAQVPYRFFKTFSGSADFGRGNFRVEAKMFVRDLALNCQNDWTPAISALHASGKIKQCPLWRGRIHSASCADIGLTFREILARDPWAFVTAPRQKEYAYKNACQASEQPPFKVAILGHSNLEFLKEKLLEQLQIHIPGRRVEVYTPTYGTLLQEVISADSALTRFAPDFAFFVDRVEDLMGAPDLDAVNAAGVSERVDLYIGAVKHYRERHAGWLFVNNFFCTGPTACGVADETEPGMGSILKKFRERLEQSLSGLPQVHLFDLSRAAGTFEHGAVFDPRLWFLGRIPFSYDFTRHLARRYTALLLSVTGRTARVVLLDLDNTLWGGILGEDGISGVKIGGDYPGNAYAAFQQKLKRLSERGIALAACSKNDESHALEAMNTLPEMAIRPHDLVSHRINWKPKWQNAIEICRELNLGMESALFIDDNPIEREQMRHHCPGIKVLELPIDPVHYGSALLDSPWLECVELTAEDFNRVKSYKARQEVESFKSAFSDMGAFYASLGLRIHFNPLSDLNLQRTLQLLQKTNQFNATTRRHDRGALEALIAGGAEVIVIGAEDKFNAMENLGVLIVKWDCLERSRAGIDTYLLSCRALGKGIETGVLHWLKSHALSRGCTELIGEIIETERNCPAREIFKDSGFVPGPGPGQWIYRIRQAPEAVPSWLAVVDNVTRKETICAA